MAIEKRNEKQANVPFYVVWLSSLLNFRDQGEMAASYCCFVQFDSLVFVFVFVFVFGFLVSFSLLFSSLLLIAYTSCRGMNRPQLACVQEVQMLITCMKVSRLRVVVVVVG